MPALLVLLFVVIPILEIVVIIQVGQVIGAWWTVALLVADSVLGAWLLRREGARAWRAFREALEAGRWPGDEVAQGALVIVGGTLLLTPGFITDVVGFLLLVPVSRRLVARTLRSRIGTQVVGGPGGDPRRADPRRGRGPSSGQPGVFDVEVVDVRREDDGEPSRGPAELGDRSGEDDPDDDEPPGTGADSRPSRPPR